MSTKPGVWITNFDGSGIDVDRRKKAERLEAEKLERGKNQAPPSRSRRGRSKNTSGLGPAPARVLRTAASQLPISGSQPSNSIPGDVTMNSGIGETDTNGTAALSSGPKLTRASANSNNGSVFPSAVDIVDLTGDDEEVPSAKVDSAASFVGPVPHGLPIMLQEEGQAGYTVTTAFQPDSMQPFTPDTDMTNTDARVKAHTVDAAISAGEASLTQNLEMLSDAAFEREGQRIQLSIELARLEERKLRYEEECERRGVIRL